MPLGWRNDTSGKLPEAVEALWRYVHGPVDGSAVVEIAEEQVELVRGYAVYFVSAPCWTWHNELHPREEIIRGIEQAISPDDLVRAIRRAVHVGIDVLG